MPMHAGLLGGQACDRGPKARQMGCPSRVAEEADLPLPTTAFVELELSKFAEVWSKWGQDCPNAWPDFD